MPATASRVRPRRRARAANRYEWPCPGDLLHMDTARYARFKRPGHAVTGDRSQRSRNWMRPETRVGYDFAHAIVDDHSRLAYVELHNDETRSDSHRLRCAGALAWFEENGIVAKRLMTDNAFSYVKNRSLRELLAADGSNTCAPSPTDRAPTARSSASTRPWPANGPTAWPIAHTATATGPCHTGCDHYNQRRPHSSLGGRPPISRVHNLCGQDI